VSAVTLAGRAEWLGDDDLRRLLAVLSEGGEEARVAGGAVRNTLLGMPVSDIDIATTTPPDETARRAEAAGYKAVPTGAAHGTITVVARGRPFEVTTLRADIETDGRHATVRFGRDWRADAERRDFTINALYALADGTVVDLVGGLDDLAARNIRFIGDADRRIREDRLRVLRFFRFFAWYGSGRPDAEGLKACARHKDELDRLSAERVWAELRKLLAAPDPARALLWMRQAGVLTRVLPESEKWGIDAIHGLVAAERDLRWPPDALLRLEAIVPPDRVRLEQMSDRLKLSRAERERIVTWAATTPPKSDATLKALDAQLYRGEPPAIVDRLRLAVASARQRALTETEALAEAARLDALLRHSLGWTRPAFPLRGEDIKALGLAQGSAIGRLLKALEQEWLESGFNLDRDALLSRAADRLSERQ
jgi:poly(A) polymerase